MANHGGDEKSVGGFEQYMKETARSFKECRVKNSLRRNSLQKKTLGIEKQRKISSLLLDKEERELREKYRQLQVDQKVSSFTHSTWLLFSADRMTPKETLLYVIIEVIVTFTVKQR
uniref:Uncharacterized protein n=1 Tax=Octopus bimaculoides TaxID=37653 RepID=A0A0L8HT51_OCTBM